MINKDNYSRILSKLKDRATLIAVSKTKPIEDILALYHEGHRDFGENKVQEILQKKDALPKDIRWHLIGHLQTNKVKQVLPYVYMIHTVDSIKLMQEIEKQAIKLEIPKVRCLLEIHIGQEESKTGFEPKALTQELVHQIQSFNHLDIQGLMGIATHTNDSTIIQHEFQEINGLLHQFKKDFGSSFKELSIGMSSDYEIALECGATYIRVGSLLFGERNYQ